MNEPDDIKYEPLLRDQPPADHLDQIKDSWRQIIANKAHFLRPGQTLHLTGTDDDGEKIHLPIPINQETDARGNKLVYIGVAAAATLASLGIAAVMRGRIWPKENKKD